MSAPASRDMIGVSDLRTVARLMDKLVGDAVAKKTGVMLSWEDAQGFALALHAAADALRGLADDDLTWLECMGFLRDVDGTWRFGIIYLNGLLTENVSVKGPTTLREAIAAARLASLPSTEHATDA